jgi:hypothetical protein
MGMGHGKAERPPANQCIYWPGPVPHQKWINFYTKVLAKYATSGALSVQVQVDVNPRRVVFLLSKSRSLRRRCGR